MTEIVPVESIIPPGWMTRRQKMLWRRALACAPIGQLTNIDSGLFTTWVIACDTHREACEKSQKIGLIVKSPVKGVPIQNPYLPIMNRQAEIMIRASSKLGFTPTSPGRITKGSEDVGGKKVQRQRAAQAAESGKFAPAAAPKLVVNNK